MIFTLVLYMHCRYGHVPGVHVMVEGGWVGGRGELESWGESHNNSSLVSTQEKQ